MRDNVVVNTGNTTTIDFVSRSGSAGGDALTLDTITVIGGRTAQIDTKSVESTTILTSEQIAKIPVPRDITSVALLAPGTVSGDSTFGNLASFGGASVAENQYYVNGFNITNAFAGLNFAQVPFEAIGEQQIKTGGYGAEFGRALGGVVNLTTKRGTNEFHAGGSVFYTPSSLRGDVPDTYYLSGINQGTKFQDNGKVGDDEIVYAAWAGGALIKDKLFGYALLQYGNTNADTYGQQGITINDQKSPTYVVKLDWNINDSNLLEFTSFSDKRKIDDDLYNYDVDAGSADRGLFLGRQFSETGGTNNVLKYTGYFTDTFTLSVLAGRGEFSRGSYLKTPDGTRVEYGGDINVPASGCPLITEARPRYRQDATGRYQSTCNISGGALIRKDAGDTRDQYRIDADWSLGDHLLKFGVDIDNFESISGSSLEGGRQWRYATVNPDRIANNGDEYDIVREQIVNQGATVEVKQKAYYVQDNWSVTDNFIAYVGARLDSFDNLNGFGQSFVKINDQFGPRLGFAWDVKGDATFKVFGNAGRYALPLAPTVAIRGASASLFTRQSFRFTGVDPVTGAPIGLSPTGRGAQDDLAFVNGEFGSAKDPNTIASTNLKPQYQDEYILGFESKLNENFKVGVKGIYRELKQGIDDTCDYRPFAKYAADNGLELALPNAAFPYCRLFNPGEDVITPVDVDGNGTLEVVKVDGALLSPKAKRTYKAVVVDFEGTWEKFFVQGSYTWSKSQGNTEGGVKSDIGQADTGTTQDFDYPELTDGTYGYLPNDRRHSFKVFGNYAISDEWSVGANVLIQAGRPLNCIGRDFYADGDLGVVQYGATVGDPKPYGAAYFKCGTISDKAGRGAFGTLDWTRRLDLSVAYRPAYVEGLQFKVDVFNVTNERRATSVSETGEDGTTGAAVDTYLIPTSFQAPRSVRFLVQYDF